MNGEIDGDKVDDVMLPGFRFHPTDEELVGFYLKRKIQHRTLPIELIKQVDIYKYDPWDLPKLACTEEKEWYFYCPRDRKYRNSARPNRVTVAGFWKATGTDRPIYSSNGTECIGLKKSLVFYRGRAAKGIKTDWMMHEFRLPSTSTSALPNKISDKNLPPNDSWAICRIFKKTNNMAQRALSHSWTSQIHETTASDIFNQGAHYNLFSPESISCTAETGSPIQLSSDFPLHCNSTASLSSLDIPSYKHTIPTVLKQYAFPFDLSHLEMSKSTVDVASMNFNISPVPNGDIGKTSESINFESPQQPINGGPIHLLLDSSAEVNVGSSKSPGMDCSNNEWGNMESLGFPFGLSSNVLDAWKPNFVWDSPPRPSEMSTTFSINQC